MDNQLTSKQIKEELLNLYVKSEKIFIDNGLNFSVMSGTMLGAIRHKGFIPWDDDIDIAMPRNDYDKLLELIKGGLLEQVDLSATGYEINGDFWPFLKILNPNIVVEQELNGMTTLCDRLWIDIFPFDYVNEEKLDKRLKNIAFQWKLLFYKIAQKKRLYKYKKSFVKKTVFYIYSLIFKFASLERINNRIINLSRNKTKTNVIADMTWGSKKSNKCIPAEFFDEIVDYQFEDITVKGFKEYDRYLKQIYGDYMRLPPEDQRENHGIKAWRVNENEK